MDPDTPAGASELPVDVERLAFAVGPGNVPAGTVIEPPIAVAAVDDEGQTVTAFTGLVTLTLESEGGDASLTGGTARRAVNGVATFPDLAVSEPGQGYRLTAVADGVPATRSERFDVLLPRGVPARLLRVGGHEQVDSVGRALAAPYVVRVTDAYDTPLSGVAVHWAVLDGGGSVSPTATTTDLAGEARAWHSLGLTVGEQRVRAWLPDDPAIETSFTAVAIHASPHALVFTVQPSTTPEDRRIEPPVEVTILDRYGNVATRARDRMTMSLVPFTGSAFARLRGHLDVVPTNGVARFDDLRINVAGGGYRLRASYGPLVADSDPFVVVER
ncbi:MAG TPA: Ig-like domain-containing protein [Gemmatimonadaceae bacterium]